MKKNGRRRRQRFQNRRPNGEFKRTHRETLYRTIQPKNRQETASHH